MARRAECLEDCAARETGRPEDCSCAERFEDLYDQEMEARVDRLRDRWVEED